MDKQVYGVEKLKQVLINDKHVNSDRLNQLLTSEVYKVLLNYLDIYKEDIMSKISLENGKVVFRLKVSCNQIKIVGMLN